MDVSRVQDELGLRLTPFAEALRRVFGVDTAAPAAAAAAAQ
jgi:hypothetical protein